MNECTKCKQQRIYQKTSVVKFTTICTVFTYQEMKKYDKVYRDGVLRGNG